jgi:tetratricopeptide (TPR) repeat protein
MKLFRATVRRALCFVPAGLALLILTGTTYALAQNATDMINLFNSIVRATITENIKNEWNKLPQNELTCLEQRFQQRGVSIRYHIDHLVPPNDPRLSSLRFDCRTVIAPPPAARPASLAPEKENLDSPGTLSAKPTFDCTQARSARGRILCFDEEGAAADWDLTSAYRARSFSLPETAREAFNQAHEDWFPKLDRSCGLKMEQSNFSTKQRWCILTAFRNRAASYRSKLTGDALVESRLSPEKHAKIQLALIARNFLDDDVDGQFGAVTRRAIKRFQAQSGFSEGEFLTAEQRQALLQEGPPQSPEGPGDNSGPGVSPNQARLQCQSPDATARFTGCTIIIDAKGWGSKKTLADALDGRCWASNDLQQYEHALADCKASIALNPRYFYAYNNLGRSLLGLGDIPNAIKAFTKAIDIKPTFIYSRLGRGKAYVVLGNNELARKDFAFVLTINPENQEAKVAIDNLPAPPETEKLKEARLVLDDIRKFIAEQKTVFPIPPIATEAANLQLALDKFDEVNAVHSMTKLQELLKPINGFDEFVQNRQDEREANKLRQLDEAKKEAARNIYFIDSYVKVNLGDSKTPSLMKLRQQIDHSRGQQSIEEIVTANNSLHDYIKENRLENLYRDIVKDFSNPEPPTPVTPDLPEKRLGISDKSRFVIEGPADHIVLLYNASSSAPRIAKNVRGDFVFQENSASLCLSQSPPDVALVHYLERILGHEGAKQVLSGPQPCDLSVVTSSIDIIAFKRGELLKQNESFIAALVKLIEQSTFRQYKIITDYPGEQRLAVLSLQIESELEKNAREGYGILALGEFGAMCVVPPKDSKQSDGLKLLLTRDRNLIAPKLAADWQFVTMSTDLAFLGVQRRQCAYVAGDATTLRTLMEALRREQLNYKFAPVWFRMQEVARATFDALDEQIQKTLKDEQEKQAERDRQNLDQQRERDNQLQKSEIERQLRQKNGVRARGLMSDITTSVKALAEKREVDKSGWFSTYSTWLNKRFADQWETFNVTSEVADFGTVQWNGRALDAIIVKAVIQQKNRVLGKYEDKCFMFGLVDDVEFAMHREPFSAACDSGDKFITTWKVGKKFQSQWNADNRVAGQ